MQIPKISKLFAALCAAIFCSSLMIVRADDTPAQAAARVALLQKLQEMAAQPAVPPPVIVTPSDVKVETPAPAVIAPPAAPEKVVIEKTEAPASAAPMIAPAIVEPKPPMVVKPVETPALPISATKEERLQALLNKYKADQITPAEYHTERAKIIGEP